MELVINGKKISYIRTLHMTQCDCDTAITFNSKCSSPSRKGLPPWGGSGLK